MPSIEKTTIPVSKAAMLIISICGLLLTGLSAYVAAINGVKDAFTDIKLEIRDIRNDDKLQDLRISTLQKSLDFNLTCIQELQSAIKPEEPKIKHYEQR